MSVVAPGQLDALEEPQKQATTTTTSAAPSTSHPHPEHSFGSSRGTSDQENDPHQAAAARNEASATSKEADAPPTEPAKPDGEMETRQEPVAEEAGSPPERHNAKAEDAKAEDANRSSSSSDDDSGGGALNGANPSASANMQLSSSSAAASSSDREERPPTDGGSSGVGAREGEGTPTKRRKDEDEDDDEDNDEGEGEGGTKVSAASLDAEFGDGSKSKGDGSRSKGDDGSDRKVATEAAGTSSSSSAAPPPAPSELHPAHAPKTPPQPKTPPAQPKSPALAPLPSLGSGVLRHPQPRPGVVPSQLLPQTSFPTGVTAAQQAYSGASPYHAHAQQQQAAHAQRAASLHQTQYQNSADYQDATQFVVQDDIDEAHRVDDFGSEYSPSGDDRDEDFDEDDDMSDADTEDDRPLLKRRRMNTPYRSSHRKRRRVAPESEFICSDADDYEFEESADDDDSGVFTE